MLRHIYIETVVECRFSYTYICIFIPFDLGANMVGPTFSVDMNKPLAFQVGHLGEAYDEWVHQPIVAKESPRFFHNDFIERFTRTPWWVVPLFWLPIVWWLVSSKNGSHLVVAGGGVLLFSLLEYCLHRFLFHFKTTTYWGNTVHYILHGCHHKHPMDHLRLVLPPPLAALFIITFWYITKLFIAEPYLSALIGGELLGYIIYDCTHYHLHHAKSFTPLLLKKRYHMSHHFRIHEKGFGVTTTFWDWVFGTLPSD
ncbi:dihydroceramide fatty acyl 2-hydroxylase FAH1-like [Salvia splendens]|uniref:dihydroceramide fatty acyl 2-hydroxylase FAH1-like n=1 Tax=Salvia splendens TaxID=180675 RepID=UPI001C25BAEF|nr:dihydroceramide fatty acyl 2-hydroxylase FAH1-like [Salvia splendens]